MSPAVVVTIPKQRPGPEPAPEPRPEPVAAAPPMVWLILGPGVFQVLERDLGEAAKTLRIWSETGYKVRCYLIHREDALTYIERLHGAAAGRLARLNPHAATEVLQGR